MQDYPAGSRFLLTVPAQCTPVRAQIGHLALGDTRSPKWPQYLDVLDSKSPIIYGSINHWDTEGVCAEPLKELQ